MYENFEKFFFTKQGFLASKKYKKYSFEYNGYKVYLKKAERRKFLLLAKNAQI